MVLFKTLEKEMALSAPHQTPISPNWGIWNVWRPLEYTTKAKPKVGAVRHLVLTPEPLQLRLILSEASRAIMRLLLSWELQVDVPCYFRLPLQWEHRVWEKLRCRGGHCLLLTELLWFFSLHLLMEFETQKDTSSCSLKSSLLSACLFPFLKGHLHNSEQPACLAFTKENFKQA